MNLRRVHIILFCLCAFALPSFAANIQISELSDLDFGRVSPTGGSLSQYVTLCISMDTRDNYDLTAYGLGVAGAFELDGVIATLPFRAFYSDRRNRRGRELRSGEPLLDLRSRGPLYRGGCRRRNARLTIMMDNAQLQTMPSGRYRGTLTLMVSPQ